MKKKKEKNQKKEAGDQHIKTKTIKQTTIQRRVTEKEIEVIDRDHYIQKFLDHEKTNPKNIVIEIYGGCLNKVYNIPKDYDYILIDWDNLKEMDEIEFKELINNITEG